MRATHSAALFAMDPWYWQSAERPRFSITSTLGRELDTQRPCGKPVWSLLPDVMPVLLSRERRCAMPISADPLSGDVSIRPKYDHGRLIAARQHSATSGRRPCKGTPVAGAPGWHVVRPTAPVLSGYPMGRLRHFRLMAVMVTVGLIVLVLSMVRADWSEELTRARGIVAADGRQRDEVRAFEEASARPSAELTPASTRQSELESARACPYAHLQTHGRPRRGTSGVGAPRRGACPAGAPERSAQSERYP
jgi:hypothetical protein